MCGHICMSEYADPVFSSFLPVNFQAVRFNRQNLLTEMTLKEMHHIHNGKKHYVQQLKQNKIYLSKYIANAQESNLDITGSITVLCFVPLKKLKYTYKSGNLFVCQIALSCCAHLVGLVAVSNFYISHIFIMILLRSSVMPSVLSVSFSCSTRTHNTSFSSFIPTNVAVTVSDSGAGRHCL